MKRVGVAFAGLATSAALAGSAMALEPSIVTNPDWLRKPSAEDIGGVYPREAMRAGVIGRARIGCTVSVRGALEQCAVLSESPSGWGFGAAAVAMTRYFSWSPKTVDGAPVGGASAVIPVDFGASSGEYGAVFVIAFDPYAAVQPLVDPIWSETPTPDQVASAFPLAAIGKADTGYATLRCRAKPDGSLVDCKALAGRPEDEAFKSAALKLADDFKLSVADSQPAVLRKVIVDVRISFAAPGKSAQKLAVPHWVRTLGMAQLAAIYPAKAVVAGIFWGGGVIKCKVTHEGRLADCQLVSETTQGLGFGDAALKAASLIAMNPWTMDGMSVDGAIVQVPITLRLPAHRPSSTIGKP